MSVISCHVTSHQLQSYQWCRSGILSVPSEHQCVHCDPFFHAGRMEYQRIAQGIFLPLDDSDMFCSKALFVSRPSSLRLSAVKKLISGS